ncbi:uncharacterized protein B0P05DRAFT_492958 [Gilbertella persicaria]|uniref:uncharacterized protein n=1 Tax=Gilbertella persicaria TaxID=101096 RepID=UPI002220A6A4|nr:uncharacterized protein B0P05DRAFT_492958 [Gilbertella persicaria]KAI8076482.1 hypothetical protein B0P05DRAFT_492958 [Gilbertella persicaria]
MNFTPKTLHYFKRELITQQLQKEIELLNHSDLLSSLQTSELIFLRYVFDHVVIQFPLLQHTCDDQFWPKCKLLLEEFNKVHLHHHYAPSKSDSAMHRKKIQYKIQKSLVFAYCACIKTVQGEEESIRIDPGPDTPDKDKQTFQVNIVTVRQAHQKKTLRHVAHPEFLIETRFPHQAPVYVARRHGEFRRMRQELKRYFKQMDIPPVPSKSTLDSEEDGYRDHDRLLLRSFLFSLTGQQGEQPTKQQIQIQKSHVLQQFLTENPVVLTPQEEQDTIQREEADQKRSLEQAEFKKELDRRVFELNKTLEELKQQIIKPGGLIEIFEIIKKTPSVHDLPDNLKKTFEWGRINFAFALHRQFVALDTATEHFNSLRRTHGLMPYKTLGFILRFSNPMLIVKSILDLFLAQPFGGKSLFQRILISNMSEEHKSAEKEIHTLETSIGDEQICKKLFQAVRTPLPPDTDFPEDGLTAVMAILANDAIPPILSSSEAQTTFTKDTKKCMVRLWELYAQQYEQERMMNLVFQGVTGELLKEFIAVFYQPLAQVYKAADISTTIRHVACFIDDLIKVVEHYEEKQAVSDSIQPFIDLVQRHEHHFYEFVHHVHRQEASRVFDDLIHYLDALFTFVDRGLPGQLDLQDCIQQAGIQSQQDLNLLHQEIEAICDYRYQQKMYRIERQKKRLMADVEQEELTKTTDLDELVFDSDDGSSEFDISRRSSRSSGSHVSHQGIERPYLELIPAIVPFFVNHVKQLMQ